MNTSQQEAAGQALLALARTIRGQRVWLALWEADNLTRASDVIQAFLDALADALERIGRALIK